MLSIRYARPCWAEKIVVTIKETKQGKKMKLMAMDIMSTNFHTLTPQIPVDQAVGFFKKATKETGKNIFGLMVIDDKKTLVGMISMYDILLFMRPKHIHVWGPMDDVDIGSILEVSFEKTRSVHVGDIMTPDVITVSPRTHILNILDIMTKNVQAVFEDQSLLTVMEVLSAYRFGALLIKDRAKAPCGVISKTDLTLAYKHGVASETPSESIMSAPVNTCSQEDTLEETIQKMIVTDVHRLFVYRANPNDMVGVISLSDAARARSGSCHACVSSRIKIK